MPNPRIRLAAVTTHPIQYQVPLWRRLSQSAEFDLRVFYASRQGLEKSYDDGFGIRFAWDVPLLDGYLSSFLPSLIFGGRKPSHGWAFPRGLTEELKRNRCDAILVHGYTTAAAAAGALAAWRLGIPLVMRGESHLRDPRPRTVAAFKGFLLRQFLRRVDGVLAIGSLNRQYWLEYGVKPEKIETAYYAVDNDALRSAVSASGHRIADLRDRWGAGPEATVFLFVGKMIPVKGVEVLLRAFGALDRSLKAHLVLVGSGQLEAHLRNVASELALANLHWEGFVNQSDLPRFYAAADVLVLPSQTDTWGLVVNEAMACGTPCIVSDGAGASADLVEGQGTGLVVRRGDVDDLRRAMLHALDRDTVQLWREAIPAVMEKFTFEQNVRAFYRLYQKITNTGGTGVTERHGPA